MGGGGITRVSKACRSIVTTGNDMCSVGCRERYDDVFAVWTVRLRSSRVMLMVQASRAGSARRGATLRPKPSARNA
jgi:hypothetical protein